MADLNDAPDLQTITASGVTGTDLFYVWDTSASVAKTLTFTEQRKLTLEVVESAPNNGTVAWVALNPAGVDNTIILEAVEVGTAGNSLTAAIAIDATTNRYALTVVKTGNAISITSGDRYRMIVSGTLSPNLAGTLGPTYTYAGLAGGKPSYASSGASTRQIYWTIATGKWTLANLLEIGNRWESSEDVDTPDQVVTWTAVGSATGTPTITAAAASALQAYDLVNSELSGEVVATLPPADVYGPIAAVAATAFTGGAGPTASNAPFLVNGSTLYVNVGTVAAPEWKEKELDNIP
jgi:hypothetical protein